jgi:cytidine deaminase
LSVSLVDVKEGHDREFQELAAECIDVISRKGYGRAGIVQDEAMPLRFYAVRHWNDAGSAAACHADPEMQRLTARLYQMARVMHVVNGVRKPGPQPLSMDERRAGFDPDRRAGFDRRVQDLGRLEGDRRSAYDRRLGPRRLRAFHGIVDLVAAARRAREHADAAFSKFKVGAALETADGTVVTGCNIENATYGLTMCAERVAMFKAISEGHRAFARIAIVADTERPTPPCGACRQILWEFGGNLEVVLANLFAEKGRYRLTDLLPLPFDARLL